jgi:hypothetical protein
MTGAETGPRTVRLHGGLVSMTLPAGWYEIDPAHMDELTLWTADATGGRVGAFYQHGFRPMLAPDQPGLPQLTVQIREDGRLRYGDFIGLSEEDASGDGPLSRHRDGLPPLVVGVAVERVSFDPASFTIRLEHALDLRVRGRARVLTAARLTERGFIAFHYIDRERRIETGRELFDAVLDSVEIAPELAYRPRLLDRWPGLPFFGAAAAVALVLAVYLAVRSRHRQ